MQAELRKLQEENDQLRVENKNQLTEIQRLQFVDDKNERLTDEVIEANQRVRWCNDNEKMQFKIRQCNCLQ